jgi:hypothetical protein
MSNRFAALAAVLVLSACPKPRTTLEDAMPPASVTSGIDAAARAPVLAPSASSSPPRPTGCIEIDEDRVNGKPVTLLGTVSSGKHSHPNGSSFTFYALALATPRCVLGLDETKTVTEVQIYGDEGTPLAPYVGKRVRVDGEPFGELTAWHVRPVVVHVTKIDAQ